MYKQYRTQVTLYMLTITLTLLLTNYTIITPLRNKLETATNQLAQHTSKQLISAPTNQPNYWKTPDTGPLTIVLLHIHDGDTVEAAYLVPFTIRIHGINAPELNTPAGKTTTEALKNKLPTGRIYNTQLYGREKYGRTLADIWFNDENDKPQKISEWLIQNNLAKPWDGTGKAP